MEEEPVYARGRPKADGARKVKRVIYRLKLTIVPREKAIDRARKEAGCFVLITNEPEEAMGGMSSKELLRASQDQHSVEQNFGFLKEPVFVNALFLKTPRRIEALGLVLVLALMVWRLMERTMRISLKQEESKVVGHSAECASSLLHCLIRSYTYFRISCTNRRISSASASV